MINSQQHGETCLAVRASCFDLLVFAGAQQLWIQLGNVVSIKAVSAVESLVDLFYRLSDAVLATTPLFAPGECHSLLTNQFAVSSSLSATLAGALQAISTPVSHKHLVSHGNHHQAATCSTP